MASPGIRPGLARLARLLRLLGSPERSFRAVHVAGTNGKGSTAAGIESVLRCSGYKTALYTSPHLVSFSERLLFSGTPAPLDDWKEACSRLSTVIEKDKELRNDRPTYFELATAAAIILTAKASPEVAVFETGMGGRLDATNILPDILLSVIVPIGMDHMEYLGNSLAKIASEKFAIMRNGRPAIFFGNPELNAEFLERAETVGAHPHIFTNECSITESSCSLSGTSFTLECGGKAASYCTPLIGTFQKDNAALAVAASRLLASELPHITPESIQKGISSTVWGGRMEVVSSDPLIIIDGGHNSHAAVRLAESIKTLLADQELNIVIAMMKDKDVLQTLALFRGLKAKFYCTEVPGNERSMKAQEMLKEAKEAGLVTEGSFCEPLEALHAATANKKPTLCCGSLFLAGCLKERKNEF